MHGVILTVGGQRLASVSQWTMHVVEWGLPDLRGTVHVKHAGSRLRDHAQKAPLQFELSTERQTWTGLAWLELTGRAGTFVAAGPWSGWTLHDQQS